MRDVELLEALRSIEDTRGMPWEARRPAIYQDALQPWGKITGIWVG